MSGYRPSWSILVVVPALALALGCQGGRAVVDGPQEPSNTASPPVDPRAQRAIDAAALALDNGDLDAAEVDDEGREARKPPKSTSRS